MNIKHEDIKIPKDDPFANCKLNRLQYAEALTNILTTYAEGFVLSINNRWGTGKTTFVKMWEQLLINKGFKTLYFNAWENDFDSNPLVALISELQSLKSLGDNPKFKLLLNSSAVLAKNILPLLVKTAATKYFGTSDFNEIMEKSTEAAAEIFKDEVEGYTQKKKGINEFRKQLQNLVKDPENDKPLVFIIDELDRCRPNYSVELLEQIKHFFNVKGIVFVLSIDKDQLGHAVRGFYGSDRLDTDEYLRRFIDLEYVIPTPSTKEFCRYLFTYFQFGMFFKKPERMKFSQLNNDADNFLNFSIALFETTPLTLRQQERIFAHTKIVLNQFDFNDYVFPRLLVLLIYIKFIDFEFYGKIRSKSLDMQSLIDGLVKFRSPSLATNMIRSFESTAASLILFYHTEYFRAELKESLFQKDETTGKNYLLVKSGILFNNDDQNLLTLLEQLRREIDFSSVTLEHLLPKIDLTKNIIV